MIVENWDKLKEVFQVIFNDVESDENAVCSSNGFLNEMDKFEFTFLAIVFNEIFGLTAVLFDILQKKSLDVGYCVTKIKSTGDILKSTRDDRYFVTLFENAIKLTNATAGKRQKMMFS
ncbi:hypothetical protein ANN_27222 [Periplaneta americana]|uniref:Uncharacterized protein n=1 Tax=Periplaneta americana TaxID=6978 RepID=A0ABQ8RXL0_PERAM|nr:hypothetical protein ANN_27222 [Periplaneta americana]